MAAPGHERDSTHWLYRLSPAEWISAALGEFGRVKDAFGSRDVAAAIAGLKRAAGMALNAALIVRPRPEWGRSYVEHLRALADDAQAPAEVRDAARRLLALKPPGGAVVSLRTRSDDQASLEAARVVMAHAYALVHGSGGQRAPGGEEA
jgi:hypothetical protein